MLDERERQIERRITELKKGAGSHSPSIFSLLSAIPELQITVDACFLSNPYATDLFMKYFQKEVLDTGKLRSLLEYYPTQNRPLASVLSPVLRVPPQNILLGNGAVEIIQALIHRFVKKKMLVVLPTFSPYYEFARPDTEVIFFVLEKTHDFRLDVKAWLRMIDQEKPDTVILINPNNPDGGYLSQQELRDMLSALSPVEQIILDESFIHFAHEDNTYHLISYRELCQEFPHLITVKSMSKDFGVAGIRAGYAIMAEEKVKQLLQNGYLWNISGIAEYFFRLFARSEFQEEYEPLRIRYIQEMQEFYCLLTKISGIKVYPSRSNFFLVELLQREAEEVAMELLIRYGIYIRGCGDKKGLEGNFIRVASRKAEENRLIAQALQQVLN